MAVKNSLSHTILSNSKWIGLYSVYYKRVFQYLYLLLITPATCFDHNSIHLLVAIKFHRRIQLMW